MKSALFMMEQIIVILIFAVCVATCVEMFAASFIMSRDSRDMNNALLISESGAESYKATSGDAKGIALVLGGHIDGDGNVSVYYDEKRQVCVRSQAAYIMSIEYMNPPDAPSVLILGDISVTKANGEQIITFTAAARREIE